MDAPPPGNSFDALINQASADAKEKDIARKERAGRKKNAYASRIGPVVATIAIVLSLVSIWNRLAPPSERQLASDLEQIVDQARLFIDESRSANGELPEGLPAGLASVVQYEHAGKTYRLTATVLAVRVTLESDGSRRTDFGVGK